MHAPAGQQVSGDGSQGPERHPGSQADLLLRPLEFLLAEPHILSGWLSINRDSYTMIDGWISWNENPVELLADTYHFLNMDYVPGAPAASMIWDHDNELLQAAVAFYDELNKRLAVEDWIELQTLARR